MMHNEYRGKLEFLEKNLFYRLTNLNTGFDNLSMRFFSPKDFLNVMERCKLLGFGIFGIESWSLQDKVFLDARYYENWKTYAHDGKWYYEAYNQLLDDENELMFTSTYYLPSYDI